MSPAALAAASVLSLGDRNSAGKEKFNPCSESPCSRLRKTETGPPAAEPRAAEESSLGKADEGERESHRRGVLGLREVPQLGKPPDNPHALTASVGWRKSFHSTAASGCLGAAPAAAKAQRGPRGLGSLLQGCSGLVRGAERCHTVLQPPGRMGACQQGRPSSAGHSRGQPGHRRAERGLQATAAVQEPVEPSHLALVPEVSGEVVAQSACQVPVASSSYGHRAWAMPGNPGRTPDSSTGMCQGLLRKPWVLSCRGKEQRKQRAVTGTASRAAVPTAPSRIFTPCASTEPWERPIPRGLARVPRTNPTTLSTISEGRGYSRALARVCSRPSLPHGSQRSLLSRKALA